jgi:transposase InsO family protein
MMWKVVILSPVRRRRAIERVPDAPSVSARQACPVIGQHCSMPHRMMAEARVLIKRLDEHYNLVRPHRTLGYRPPAPEAIVAGPPFTSRGPARSGFRFG